MKLVKFVPSKKDFFNFLFLRLSSCNIKEENINKYLDICIKNCTNRFSLIKNKYFQDSNNIYFRSGHYCQLFIFLYELSRIIFLENNKNILLEKIFFLNTIQTNLDVYYTTKLPEKFFPVHPFGSIIGSRTLFRKNSSLIIYNNCSLGRNDKDVHPEIEGELIMLPNSSIIGKCKIIGKVILSNGCYLYNAGDIKDKIIFGKYPNNIYKDINLNSFSSWNEFIN